MAWIAAIALAPPVQAAAPDSARCALQIVATPSQWRVADIDAFSSEPTLASFDVQLVNSGAEPCKVRLSLDTQGEQFGVATASGRRVAYSVVDAASGNDVTPRSGRSLATSRKMTVVPPHGEVLSRFDFTFLPAFDTDGLYSQPLLIQALDMTDNSVVSEKQVSLSAAVVSSATIALSGNFTRVGGVADVDLGDLDDLGNQPPILMHVRSTRAYRIRSTSENGGKLVLAGTDWSIPYKLTIDGAVVDPANGSYLSSPGNTRRVDNLRLGFAITGSTDVQAGRYSDLVTLEIALN